MSQSQFVRAATLADVEAQGCKTVQLDGHVIALFAHNDTVYAVDNRCPHMGFPLEKGIVKDGILTCFWHYARFDLESGGTFDQFADDVRSFPTEIRDGEVWVDLTSRHDERERQRERLQVGLERDLPLVMGKAVLVLTENGGDPKVPFKAGLQFGVQYRQQGWGQGLTMHTCFMNLYHHLHEKDQPRALYHGLAAVSRDTAGSAPRFPIRPLPTETTNLAMLKRWFRSFVEVRDDEGAERCIVSAIRAGADHQQLADMMFAAATDHRYIDVGHVLDFTNKAFEALDIVGWDSAEQVLTSLATSYAFASRMEESNAWRNPIDLIVLLDEAFAQLPEKLAAGRARQEAWNGRKALVQTMLRDDPATTIEQMLAALAAGCTPVALAATASFAAALRIAQFHTSNEFGDWDTALHTFTFANAVEQGLRRVNSIELLRGVFDAAMSVYLDRFLNIPAARLPAQNGRSVDPQALLATAEPLLNKQQQVNPAGQLVADYLFHDGEPEALLAMIGKLLLREDRDFHTIQAVEAAVNQYNLLQGSEEAMIPLVAAARYLAAHAPTVRAQGQTYQIAVRLHRGDLLFAA